MLTLSANLSSHKIRVDNSAIKVIEASSKNLFPINEIVDSNAYLRIQTVKKNKKNAP